MATQTKQMKVNAGTATATVNTTINDGLPAIPCFDPAGYRYVGARYVPIFAEPIEWNSANSYEPLTIVLHEGNSYTSKMYVPVGIDIENEDYWACTGNYNAQIEQYRKEVEEYLNSIKFSIGTLTSSMGLNDPNTNASVLEQYLQEGPVYVDTDVQFNDTLNIPNNAFIQGFGSLNGPVTIQAEVETSGASATCEKNKVTSPTPFVKGGVALVYEEGVNRQAVLTIDNDGNLLNSIYYTNCNTADIYKVLGNIVIRDITINGKVSVYYASNVLFDNVTFSSTVIVSGSVYVTFDNSTFNFNVVNNYLDVEGGSSLVSVRNCIANGGGTTSDNGAIKFNETFDSYINATCSAKTIDGGGSWHSIFIDSAFTEEGYRENRSNNIVIDRCDIADDIFVSISDNVKISNCYGRIHTKNSNGIIRDSVSPYTYIESNGNDSFTFERLASDTVTINHGNGMVMKECTIVNSFTTATNMKFIDCTFAKPDGAITFTECDQLTLSRCTSTCNINFTKCDIVNVDLLGDVGIAFRQCNKVYGRLGGITDGGSFYLSFYDTIDGIVDVINANDKNYGYNETCENLTVNTIDGSSFTNGLGGSIIFGESVPTTGYHKNGQIVLNSKPSINEPLLWICLANGTPGTWVPFGTITNG